MEHLIWTRPTSFNDIFFSSINWTNEGIKSTYFPSEREKESPQLNVVLSILEYTELELDILNIPDHSFWGNVRGEKINI